MLNPEIMDQPEKMKEKEQKTGRRKITRTVSKEN